MSLYNVYRIYFNHNGHGGNSRLILSCVTLEEAKKHCSDPETSSSTCKLSHNVRRTRNMGQWFDGFSPVK